MSGTSRRSRTSPVTLFAGVAVRVASREKPRSPAQYGTIPDQAIAVGGTIDRRPMHQRPNGKPLAFAAFSSDPDIATAHLETPQ